MHANMWTLMTFATLVAGVHGSGCRRRFEPLSTGVHDCSDADAREYTFTANMHILKLNCIGTDASISCKDLPPISGLNSSSVVVQVSGCELPQESLQCIVRAVGARDLNVLKMQYIVNTVEGHHLAGLDVLRKLEFLNSTVASDALDALPALTSVVFEKCNVPDDIYSFKSSLNLTALQYLHCKIKWITPGKLERHSKLRNLALTQTSIADVTLVVRGLRALRLLDMSHNGVRVLDPLVFSTHTPNLNKFILNIHKIPRLQNHVFFNLTNLEWIDLKNCEKGLELEDTAFSNLPSLRKVLLDKCSISELPATLLLGSDGLRELSLTHNALKSLPAQLLAKKTELQQLNLNFNKLQTITSDMFAKLPSLTVLHLAYNTIRVLPEDVFQGMPRLKELFLTNNQLASPDCLLPFRPSLLPALKTLHLKNNNITYIHRSNLEGAWNNTNINLIGNNIKSVLLSDRSSNLSLWLGAVQCDCLARGIALAALADRVHGAYCTDTKKALKNTPLDELVCRPDRCPSNCSCSLQLLDDYSTRAEHRLVCPHVPTEHDIKQISTQHYTEAGLKLIVTLRLTRRPTSLHVPASVRRLVLSRLALTDTLLLDSLDLTSLEELDLSLNNLSRVPLNLMARLKTTTVNLTGNDIDCTCEELETLGPKYAEQCCRSGHRKCYKMQPVFWVLAATAGAALATMGLLYHYRHNLKVLVRHQFSTAKEYDAYIAHANCDSGFVVEELIPWLEQCANEHALKLCLPVRDWEVGAGVAAEVARSVLRSRCTVVLLSHAALCDTGTGTGRGSGSASGTVLRSMLEAHSRATQLVLLALDEVPVHCLPIELRPYFHKINRWKKDNSVKFWNEIRKKISNVVHTGPEIV